MENTIMENEEIKDVETSGKSKRKLITIISIAVVLVLIVAVVLGIRLNKDYINQANYQRIEVGMTYDDVKSILGGKDGKVQYDFDFGDEDYGSVKTYCWVNKSNKKSIVVVFMNNVVSSKSFVDIE